MSKKRVHVTANSSAAYMRAVDYLLNHVQDTDLSLSPNKYSFVLIAASALEAIINAAIILWAHSHFGQGDYRRMALAFLSMNLRGKLDSFLYLITDGRYLANNESETYRHLADLITLRNQVAHAKNFYREFELEFIDNEAGLAGFEISDELRQHLNDTPLSLARVQCRNYQIALHHLYGLTTEGVDPDDFDASTFCKRVHQGTI